MADETKPPAPPAPTPVPNRNPQSAIRNWAGLVLAALLVVLIVWGVSPLSPFRPPLGR